MSLQKFLVIGITAVFLCGCFTAAMLWYSTHYTKIAIERLTDSVESATSTELIQQNLSIHQRQALLRGIHSQAQRKTQTTLAKERLLLAVANLYGFASSPEETATIQKVDKAIQAYIDTYESYRNQGVQGENLYQAVSEEYYKSQTVIQELMDFNLSEANQIQAETAQQNQLNYSLVTFAFFLLSISFCILLLGLRRYFYRPMVKLNKVIENFELGQNIGNGDIEGAREIQAISSSFQSLSTKLKKQKELQRTLLSAIAHDLKNPLGAIKMSAELIAEDDGISAQSKQMLFLLGRQTDHLMRLINDLLDTTRLESGNLELHFDPCDIRGLIKDSAALHSNLSTLHRFELDLPKEPLFVLCDEQRLTQVFNNLFNNALKYSPHGGNIFVKAFTSGDQVIVEISDSGVGILPEDLEGIFEPFRRSSITRTTIPGIGLGLPISRKIVRSHEGGDILVSSQPGQGTTFTIKLRKLDGSFQEKMHELHSGVT
jgi:signal transduction histidine kinase